MEVSRVQSSHWQAQGGTNYNPQMGCTPCPKSFCCFLGVIFMSLPVILDQSLQAVFSPQVLPFLVLTSAQEWFWILVVSLRNDGESLGVVRQSVMTEPFLCEREFAKVISLNPLRNTLMISLFPILKARK